MSKKNRRQSQINRANRLAQQNNKNLFKTHLQESQNNNNLISDNLLQQIQQQPTPITPPTPPTPDNETCPPHLTQHLGTHWINIKDLKIDRYEDINKGYQRPPKLTIKELQTQPFDPNACQIIDVALRADGTYWVIDGQQRTTRAGFAKQEKIQAKIIYSTGRTFEATLYVKINNQRKKMTPIELYQGNLASQDPTTDQIQQILNKHNLTIGGKTKNSIQCVNAIKSLVQDTNPQTLDTIIQLIQNTWPNEPNNKRYTDYIFKALAIIFKHNPTIDTQHTQKRLTTKPIQYWLSKAQANQSTTPGNGYSRYNYLAKIFIDTINTHRRNKPKYTIN